MGNPVLYIFIFLHQTTTTDFDNNTTMGCISLYSYIKPQLMADNAKAYAVVYLYIPTSNHNYFHVQQVMS